MYRRKPILFRAIKLAADALAIAASFVIALELRFDFAPSTQDLHGFGVGLPLAIFLFLLLNALFGIYSGKWKMASFDEIWGIARAGIIATIALYLSVLIIPNGRTYLPSSVALIGGAISLLVLAAERLIYRLAIEARKRPLSGAGKRVLLVGAGDAGEMVAQDMLRHPEYGYTPAAFVDDNPTKKNLVLRGIQVYGTRSDIPQIVKSLGVEEIFITIPSARGPDIREIVGICESSDVKVKIVPGIIETICEKLGVASVRELEVEDLLGREPVKIDLPSIAERVTNKVVLVTGAAGSIGAEISRQLIRLGPQLLVLLDHDETALFEIGNELAIKYSRFEIVVGDIRERERIKAVFRKYKPDMVFHSAAMKHVPLMQEHPCEAVKSNILGTLNVAEAAVNSKCKRFVLISTDKAVNPSNIMGATKRVAELLIKKLNTENGTVFGAVRFGNVLGSRGSVVPTFEQQIKRGGPVLVTDPEATRFFMTIGEAAQLVIQASAFVTGGEIFILDMGEPVRIFELAEKMIAITGKSKDIPIHFTGLRPGEKLDEVLTYENETLLPTSHPKISLAKEEHNGFEDLNSGIELLAAYALEEQDEGVRDLLMDLVLRVNAPDNF